MKRVSILMFTLCACFAFVAWPQTQPQGHDKIITFKVPDAGTSANQGTYVNRIVESGAVTGWYIDSNGVYHGFIRTPGGVITKVDAPAAENAPGLGTVSEGMNSEQVTTGYYIDSNDVYHGYVRTPDGRFTIIDVPAAGTGQWQGTIASNINAWGTVLGVFIDTDNNWHYFLRSLFGRFTTFDAPDEGAGVMALGWGYPDALNDAGAATSMFIDGNGLFHGWLRTPDGMISRIDVAGAGTGAFEGTFSVAINWEGTMVGGFIPPDESFGNVQGFVRDVDGNITPFAPPVGKGTVQSNAINGAGEIVGTCWSWNAEGVSTGVNADAACSRAPDGTYSVYSLPGAGTGNYQGTYGIDVNSRGSMAGYVIDSNFVTWSFVMAPQTSPHKPSVR